MELKYLMAFTASLIITILILPKLIPFLHKIKFGQSIRVEGPQSHLAKSGTPTMGGVVFVIVPLIVVAFIDINIFFHRNTLLIMMAFLGYALIGFIDDFIIVVRKNNAGLGPAFKFLLQSLLAIGFYWFYQDNASTSVNIPLINISLELGWLYFGLLFIMFTAETNAVNLTDGLDGLCAGNGIIAIAPFILFAIMQKEYEVALLLLAISGAILGYLNFNLHPAKIFMGDSGSLAIGGVLAASAMVLKQELLLLIIGGIFLVEVISVVLQVTYYKISKKRIFLMAPLHHHFELKGHSEKHIVIVFWIIGLGLAIVGFIMGVI